VTESFLHYIWQFQYLSKTALLTTMGQEISVFHPGQRNPHSGPDFSNARVRIGEIEWMGSVEIHIHSSGWLEHHHNTDPTYDNVILHVVWKNDKTVTRSDGSDMPTLELKDRVSESLLIHYNSLMHNPEEIPCGSRLDGINTISKLSMLDKVLTERLESKAQLVLKVLQRNNNDWEETAYQMILKNFGFKVNTEPFQQLAQSVSYKFLLRHADQWLQVEALLFGQAGFLEENSADQYYRALQREYKLLSQKYQLTGKKVSKTQWRFLRLRPANFPTLRIAQFASLIHHRKNFFSSILSESTNKGLRTFFSVQQSAYWMRHYSFFREQPEDVTILGELSIDNIIINSVVPVLAAYGKSRDDDMYVDRAVRILQQMHPESNMIIRHWNSLGLSARTAFDSQGLLHLYNNYCLKRRCLDCNIGASLINPRNT